MTEIMVVDDQPNNRRIIARLAGAVEDNLNVSTFANPLDALEHARDITPDLLITDYKMTPINGDEFIRRFRRVPSCVDVPVIVITAHEDVEYRDRSMKAGSTDFIISPIDHQDFKIRSRRVLAASRRHGLENSAWDAAARWDEAPPLVDKAAADAAIRMVSLMMNTVTEELAASLAELQSTKNDLRYLLGIIDVAAILIDGNLLVRGFTPLANSIFRLTASDIGTPLNDIPTVLDYRELRRDVQYMVASRQPLDIAVPARGSHLRYGMRLTPSLREDGSVDGAALTFRRIAG